MNTGAIKKVVIVGGGFAGLHLAKEISKDKNYEIILIDKNNYNFFPPLIYQVATGFLETSSISYPFRKLFRKNKRIHFRMGLLQKVDPSARKCHLDNGEIRYDFLVFATGAETNYFGNENITHGAIAMKNINDALQMRNTLLQVLEQASISKDAEEQKKLLTIVVAGAGPTGVEVAGMLAELRRYVIQKDYPELINVTGDIYIVESAGRLLPQMSTQSHIDAHKALLALGVNVKMNTRVMDFTADEVHCSDGEIIKAKNLIWTTGVIAISFEGIPLTCLGKNKRMLVDEYNKVIGLENIYAIGDSCLQISDPRYPGGHPQLAQTAIQHGKRLAKNLSAMVAKKPLTAFHYFDKGSMAIIGRHRAVVDIPKPLWHFKGLVALLMWLFIHLAGLISVPNKMRTLYNWIWAYFTRDQSLRMIIRPGAKGQNDI